MTMIDNTDYKCLDCGAEFDTAEAMNEHIDAEHTEGYGDDPEGETIIEATGLTLEEAQALMSRMTHGC